MPAIPFKKTATDNNSPWNGPANEARLKGDKASNMACFAWVDPTGDPNSKSSFKFPHHNVAPDGSVGAANIKGCTAAIAVLNGGRGGANMPSSDRQGVYNHVAGHIKDAGGTPAPLKGGSGSAKKLAAQLSKK